MGNETTYTYNRDNLVSTETDPHGNTTTYTYDAVENLIATTDRNDRTIEYTYDELDRLVAETWVSDGNVITNKYDKVGNLLGVEDNFSKLLLSYDERDLLIAVDNTGTPNAPNVVLDYTYDAVGNLLSTTDTINLTFPVIFLIERALGFPLY